jgi:Stage II sporulation protein E (SpoIIE)
MRDAAALINGSLGVMRPSAPTRTAIAFASAATAFTVFVLGAAVEKWFISLVRPSAGELTWIGDVVLASSLGVVLYLWLNLRSTRAALMHLERDKIVLDTQLAVAAKIQRDLLLPPPPPRHGISWAVRLVAAGRIGGDYYDFVDLDGSSQVAIIGDIAGKGVPAAMMLVYVRAVFRQAVRVTSEPNEIVSRLASALYVETHGESYLTCIVLRIDERARRVTSTTAGHPPAIVTGANLRRLSAGGPPAGLFPVASYEQESTNLVTGDRVILVTDGITERMPWGLEPAAARVDRQLPASELCRRVFDWSQSPRAAPPVTDWDDDRTVLVVAVDE